jgi:hypothetical protein
MPDLEVGKCYRYATNKRELGKLKGMEVYMAAEHDEDGHPTGRRVPMNIYKFTNDNLGEHSIRFLEEYPCPAENAKGGRRRKTRKTRKNKSRKHRRSSK